jgi:glycine cleavage system H protein
MATVGITDHAQEALGDITFVDITSLDDDVSKGAEIGVIESVKAASDLYSPISGTVAEVNQELEPQPELVNQDPMGKGWIVKLKNFSEGEFSSLMSEEEYRASLDNEE